MSKLSTNKRKRCGSNRVWGVFDVISIWSRTIRIFQCIWPIWSHHGPSSWVLVRRPSSSALWVQKAQMEPANQICQSVYRDCIWLYTSKFMLTGGRFHFFFSTFPVDSRSISAEIWLSFIPAMRLILKSRFAYILSSLFCQSSAKISWLII